MDTGNYLLNFKRCKGCGAKSLLLMIEKHREEEEHEDEYKERITYKHSCSECGHIVSEHFYGFTVEDDTQIYEMECLLCGSGYDTRSIYVEDPKQMSKYM